ncbi:FYVE-domain-containing protein [Fistulina hepatica ATCC 64428]|uniref:FYVE-domain-containing protein n=1 Tax=Fistulina hepatica ATCC 64428 TaxID=1128425 RepID=A0A0D7AKF3_9AGAR|nr:FYVE-domain-containing protein [Fistulina hepatica ATCC 64428]
MADDDASSDESFQYPDTTPARTSDTRPSSIYSSSDYFGRVPSGSGSRTAADLTPHLSQSPEFRVPTHDAPQKVLTFSTVSPHSVHAQWERDGAVQQCRDCQRRFSFLVRRHCRRCGRIFCDRCSSRRAVLDPSEIVQDPYFPETVASAGTSHRICQSCFDQVNGTVPAGLHATQVDSMERIFVDPGRLSIPGQSRGGRGGEASSQISDLAECPVCSTNLEQVGDASAQEAHVRNCLEGGPGAAPQSSKYLVYSLQPGSVLIGTECESIFFYFLSLRVLVSVVSERLLRCCRCHLSRGVRGRVNGRPVELFLQLPQ